MQPVKKNGLIRRITTASRNSTSEKPAKQQLKSSMKVYVPPKATSIYNHHQLHRIPVRYNHFEVVDDVLTNDMVSYMVKRGEVQRPPKNFMDSSGVEIRHRAALMNWIVSVSLSLNISTIVANKALYIIDQVLYRAKGEITKNNLQCVGCAALVLACKCQGQCDAPNLEDLCGASDNSFTIGTLCKMEQDVMRWLGFNPNLECSSDFLDFILGYKVKKFDENGKYANIAYPFEDPAEAQVGQVIALWLKCSYTSASRHPFYLALAASVTTCLMFGRKLPRQVLFNNDENAVLPYVFGIMKEILDLFDAQNPTAPSFHAFLPPLKGIDVDQLVAKMRSYADFEAVFE